MPPNKFAQDLHKNTSQKVLVINVL